VCLDAIPIVASTLLACGGYGPTTAPTAKPCRINSRRAGAKMSAYKLLRRGKVAAGGSVGFGLILCIAFATPCIAKDVVESSESENDETAIEEIVVTGSRIKRRDFNTLSPLTTIGSEEFDFSGQATVEETLNRMPQVTPAFGRTSNQTYHENAGTATVNLRGLGAGRSLVLLNGRRVAASGTSSAVDLNNIPQFLIDRTEIISGGTSTVYGSDAIAGVVNFITKDDFSGFAIEAGISMAEQGDAETYDFNIAYGHNLANGRGNITVFANWLERESVFAGDREHTRVPLVDDWKEGVLHEGGNRATPAGVIVWPLVDLGDDVVEVTFNPDGTPRVFTWPDDLYNYAPTNYLQVPLSRVAVGLTGNYDLSEEFEAYVEASFIRNEPAQRLAPAAGPFFAEVNIDNPVLTREAQQLFADNYTCDTNLACFRIVRRLPEIGPRESDYERDYKRVAAGIRGELWEGWDIDGWVTYTTESTRRYLRNDASRPRLKQGLLVDPANNECFDPSGGCVPVNLFGEGNISPEGVAFIRLQDFENATERTQKLASLYMSGSPVVTWAGPLDTAVGIEWRSDDTSFRSDDRLASGEGFGWSARLPVSGTEDVYEIYAEAIVPLASDRTWAEYLGLEIGARHSEHKYAGDAETYKAGAEWQPIESLRLRAMHQRSVRAPNSLELFEAQSTQTDSFIYNDPSEDPCSASADPRENGVVEKCVLQGLPEDHIGVFEASFYPMDYIWGGNPDLRPEVGKTWTLGAVISPEFLPNWTFTIDYFEFEVTNTIGPVDSVLVCFEPQNTNHEFCENMVRDGSGNVAQLTELTNNRGLLQTTGYDTQVLYRGELPDFLGFRGRGADIGADIYWTHMLTNKEQENVVTKIVDCAGYFGRPCHFRANTFPENRVTSKVRYASGPLELHLTWQWIEGTLNAAPFYLETLGVTDPNLAIEKVSDEHYLDLGLGYNFGDEFSAYFGINNLLDNDPPQMANAVRGFNTDAGLFDVFGRSYYLTLSMHF
jgi:outer membrane receptor protein involved in Fe transport